MAYEIVPCLYDTEKDLIARLGGTICRYDNHPFYVSVESETKIRLLNIKDVLHEPSPKPFKVIHPSDELFDISSPEIGYMNIDYSTENFGKYYRARSTPNGWGRAAYYCMREPSKQWKQGVNSENIRYWSISGKHTDFPVNLQSMIYSQGMIDMLMDSYPSVPVAVYTLMRMREEKYKQIACSKNVALEKTDSDIIQVYVKGDNVGYILPGERTIHMKKHKNSWITRGYLSNLRASIEGV